MLIGIQHFCELLAICCDGAKFCTCIHSKDIIPVPYNAVTCVKTCFVFICCAYSVVFTLFELPLDSEDTLPAIILHLAPYSV
jgi:hypothetical protein